MLGRFTPLCQPSSNELQSNTQRGTILTQPLRDFPQIPLKINRMISCVLITYVKLPASGVLRRDAGGPLVKGHAVPKSELYGSSSFEVVLENAHMGHLVDVMVF